MREILRLDGAGGLLLKAGGTVYPKNKNPEIKIMKKSFYLRRRQVSLITVMISIFSLIILDPGCAQYIPNKNQIQKILRSTFGAFAPSDFGLPTRIIGKIKSAGIMLENKPKLIILDKGE